MFPVWDIEQEQVIIIFIMIMIIFVIILCRWCSHLIHAARLAGMNVADKKLVVRKLTHLRRNQRSGADK